MKSYSSVPETVVAEQLTADNVEDLARVCRAQIIEEKDPRDPSKVYKALNVPTITGMKRCSQGQYVLMIPAGYWDVMGPTEFEQKYQAD